MLRLSWTQPEDLIPHALVAAELDGRDVAVTRERWVDAGGSTDAAVSGATAERAPAELRALARGLMSDIDSAPLPARIAADEPDDLDAMLSAAPGGWRGSSATTDDRVLGAWLGRAAGCLLGKPVEKIARPGIRAIAQSTGNWPITGYFTEIGLDP